MVRQLLTLSCAALAIVLLPAACSTGSNTEPASADAAWIPLFNGQDLTGWTPKFAGHEVGVNHLDTFRVVDGLLQVSYDRYEKFDGDFGHLFFETPYSRYRLRAEYRFFGEQCPGGPGWAFRNNGLMIHGQTPESMGKDQNFPVSIEVQLLGGNGTDERRNGNLCTPGTNVVMDARLVTRHCIDSTSKTYHGDDWVTIEVEVLGSDRIRHFLDGDVVLEYERPQLDPESADAQGLGIGGDLLLSSGTISIQAESHGIEFRKIELLPLE